MSDIYGWIRTGYPKQGPCNGGCGTPIHKVTPSAKCENCKARTAAAQLARRRMLQEKKRKGSAVAMLFAQAVPDAR